MRGPARRTGTGLTRAARAGQPSLSSHCLNWLAQRGHIACARSHTRTFISLPKIPTIPNLLKPLSISSSRHYKDRTLLKYSQQEFYDLVANVDDYHKFLPWCTYSKMSAPVRSGVTSKSTELEQVLRSTSGSNHGETTTRHGELGIGFNSLQERYVSTVTCQEPWMVRAVSYDSKLFKELSTTWRFTPNVPKTTTLDAMMDQEVQEHQLLVKPTEDAETGVGQDSVSVTPSLQQTSANATSSPSTQKSTIPRPETFSTAASVFGAAAVPRTIAVATKSLTEPPEPIPAPPSALTQEQLQQIEQQHPPRPLPPPPKQTILRTASRSNLTTMNPSDFPSVWVDFEIQFEFASPVHATMSSLFFEQVSKEMLTAFVKRAEVLYGKR